MNKEQLLRKLVKCGGDLLPSVFQYPKAQKGAYNIVDSKLEKMKWAYRHWFNQIEVAEKDSGLEEYFKSQDLSFKLPEGFIVEEEISIRAGGDLLAVDILTPDNTPHIFDEVKSYFAGSDLVSANLESPVAPSKPLGRTQVLGHAAQMNTSTEMLDKFINEAGINYFSTANNHSFDWGEEGLLETIDQLDARGVYHSGMNRDQQEVLIASIKGIKVALLSFTMELNGRVLPAGKEQLINLVPFNDEVCDLSLVEKQVKEARSKGADFIIVHAHWGWGFEMYPHKNTVDIGHRIIELGVDAILGNHPHVAQPMEKYSYEKEGITKEGLIVYAMGNFVGYHPKSRNSQLAYLVGFKLAKGKLHEKERCFIHELMIMPTLAVHTNLLDGRYDSRIISFIDYYEDKDNLKVLDLKDYQDIRHLYDKVLHGILLPSYYDKKLLYSSKASK